MTGKHLFWISIIIVELVVVYVLWRPRREVIPRIAHRTPQTQPALRPPEKPPEIPQAPVVSAETRISPAPVSPRKPTAGVKGSRRSWVVNASLKKPEPVSPPPKIKPEAVPGPLESFWCNLSAVQTKCDCKPQRDQQASNLVLR